MPTAKDSAQTSFPIIASPEEKARINELFGRPRFPDDELPLWRELILGPLMPQETRKRKM